jgi:4-amino-4-deoxychorismate lyase
MQEGMQKELLETIKIEDGQVMNIEWHNRRCNKSRLELFQEKKLLNLEEFIKPPKEGLYRCRILYDTEVNAIEYIPYSPKKVSSLKVVESDIEYSYKYNNRTEINRLLEEGYDDIIIEKHGLLTDTTIANIAFYDGEQWFTPTKPLLEGTIRAKLLSENFLITKNIKNDDIQYYSHFALMNAMIGFQIYKNININYKREK